MSLFNERPWAWIHEQYGNGGCDGCIYNLREPEVNYCGCDIEYHPRVTPESCPIYLKQKMEEPEDD